MFGIDHFSVFVLSGIILNITPGADTVYILSRSISQGRKAGVFSVLGISCGSVTHTILAAFGLSAVLAGAPIAFNAVRIAGAAYLCCLGLRMLAAKDPFDHVSVKNEAISYAKIFRQGYLTNLLNPKVALFFLSFLPQFVNVTAGGGPVSFLFLGATFIFTGTLWCLLLALCASSLSSGLRRSRMISSVLNKLCGIVFIGLGVRLVIFA